AVSAESLLRITSLVDSPSNGVALCTGSLGANPEADLPAAVRLLGDRIKFAHVRNLAHTGPRRFHETAHPSRCGSLDMAGILEAYHDIGFAGPMRPDHGRMIWGEEGQPGYGLYDRALGAVYLRGLWDGIDRLRRAGGQNGQVSTDNKESRPS